MNLDYDVIIVGSGFGGAVASCRLAQAGYKTLVLERGRQWTPDTYPRKIGDKSWFWNHRHPEKYNGWIDLRFFSKMAVVQGAGVGGGSLIYANVSVEAEPFVFDEGWPPEITFNCLKGYYKTVGNMLDVQEIPDKQITERFKLMRDSAKKAGYDKRFRKLPLAIKFDSGFDPSKNSRPEDNLPPKSKNGHGRLQGKCIHCGYCDIGCKAQAKNTLDLNYLAEAEEAGAEIKPLHLVTGIAQADNKTDGYVVDCVRLEDSQRISNSYRARYVVLAAGSLGSTEILLRARDVHRALPNISQMLGRGWSANGDFLTPAIYPNRTISPTVGPTITCAINFLDGSKNGHRFFVEDGGFPDILGTTIGDMLKRTRHMGGLMNILFKHLAKQEGRQTILANIMPWFGQAIDASNGVLKLTRPWWRPFWGDKRLSMDWNVEDAEEVINAMVDMHKELSYKTGGTPLVPPTWKFLKYLITPHPLGGCRMGVDPDHGVVNSKGEVFGYPGLYVVDGAIIPKAIGLNPSRTIAALSEHIIANMINDTKSRP